ncbi:NETI motif-containing protein [Bacillaceae bacterium IKA-2]|nr:NETI motif-containing protein [Bacillaceae bacterium IKA-2]
MDKKPKKKKFFVEDGETISQCLERMSAEDYLPTRRSEEPIFHEVFQDGKMEKKVKKQKIIFEGTLIE